MDRDWRAELKDLLAAYIGHQSMELGVKEMVHVTASHRDYHDRYLTALDWGIAAAERKEAGLLQLMSSAFVVVFDYAEAAEYLRKLKAEYLRAYEVATRSARSS